MPSFSVRQRTCPGFQIQLLDPYRRTGLDRRDVAKPAEVLVGIDRGQEGVPVRPNDFGIRLTLLFLRRQMVIIHPNVHSGSPIPLGSAYASTAGATTAEAVARMPERFPNTCQAVDGPHAGADMRGVGLLPARALSHLPLATDIKEGIEQALFRSVPATGATSALHRP